MTDMNEVNLVILNSMKKLQYYDFLRYALGMKYYLMNNNQEIVTVLNDNDVDKKVETRKVEDENNQIRIIGYLFVSGRITKSFLTYEYDYGQKTFHDDSGEIYETKGFFDIVGDDILWNIMVGIVGVKNYLSYSDSYIVIDGKSYFEKLKPEQHRFILGAGINSGYNLGGWGYLIDSIRKNIRKIKKISCCKDPQRDSLLNLEKAMSNTNYIAPQILKDLDLKVYYKTIYDSLYDKFNISKTYLTIDSSIEDTTLYQVARIVSKQKEGTQVLTFNYDNVFELVLENSFGLTPESIYYKSKKKSDAPIYVIHSHGFFPYSPQKKLNPHSIVFSSYEYMNGYLNSVSYARNKLNEHIYIPNILIGNSLSDYEEQKVFFLHHKKYPSHYSFLFTVKSNETDSWMDVYKTIYYIRLGVIPVFFNSFPEMVDYLKSI